MSRNGKWRLSTIATLVIAVCVAAAPFAVADQDPSVSQSVPEAKPTNAAPQTASVGTMEVAQAVMVTAELDLGRPAPSIAEGLKAVERRYQPDDGQGRTFAILDAYGEPMPDGRLHISMHVSTEKPGMGSLVLRRTGEVLWTCKIVAATHPPSSAFAGNNLTIMLNDAAGKPQMLDGSNGPRTVLDAIVRDSGVQVRDFWSEIGRAHV